MAEKKLNVLDMVELQLIENAISARLSEIERVKRNAGLEKVEGVYEDLRDSFEKISAEYKDTEHRRKKLDDRLELQTEKIKSNEKKLFSGTITSAKELESYQDEIVSLKANNSRLEDEILELMEVLDKIKERAENARKEMESSRAVAEKIKNEMNEKLEVLKHNLEGVKKRREDVAGRIPDQYIKLYNDTKNKKSGIAVSVLKNFFCSVCNMEMPAAEVEKIEDPDELYRCPMCKRIAVVYRNEVDDIIKELEF